ncbi:MAG: hypothetical protein AAGG68_23530 [Bacteroidota bacterium]
MTTPREKQELILIWRGINIQITYTPQYFENIAHLEIQSEKNKRLPMTETGYRSHFTQAADIEVYGSPIEFVQAWLEDRANTKEWKKYEADRKQLKLF